MHRAAGCRAGFIAIAGPEDSNPEESRDRSAAIRLAIGGCDANRSAQNPSRSPAGRPSGSAMHRCAVPRLTAAVGVAVALGIVRRRWSRRYAPTMEKLLERSCCKLGSTVRAESDGHA